MYATTVRQCEECLLFFNADEPTRRFCSIVCRNEWYRDNHKGAPKKPVPDGCRWCSYHQEPHMVSQFASAERTCREGKTLRHVLNSYGVSEEQYYEMKSSLCPICKERDPKYIDHDHSCCDDSKSCGQCVRDMVCPACSNILAASGDNIEILLSAIEYIQRWSLSVNKEKE